MGIEGSMRVSGLSKADDLLVNIRREKRDNEKRKGIVPENSEAEEKVIIKKPKAVYIGDDEENKGKFVNISI